MSQDPLLQPFHLKHLTLKNRLMSTAHEPAYSEDGMPKDRYRLYHREKARGGLALTMTAGSAIVSPDSPPAFGNLHAYDDAIVPWMRALAEDCHAEGCAVMIQLTHLGRRTSWAQGDWFPVLSASPIREPAHRAFPKEAELWDLDRIIADYAAAAQRMQEAGLDGIEVQAYGHFMDSFWSPATNARQDAYGGSLENRMRFSIRVIEAIRAAVGPDFLVGLRMVADEDWDKGLSREDGVEIARRFKASGLVDFLNLIRGHIDTDAALTDVIPVQGMKSAPHLDFAGEVRAETQFPVFHAARIADVATARHAVASGKLDMVGMTRAHIADPHIVRKIREGREDRIRPCVGATYCLDRIYEGGGALCIHNAATGREAHIPHDIPRTETPKSAVIVGAGPAGLEAARVAAERGHRVQVFEAASQPGGQARLMIANPRRRDLSGIIDWRLSELERLGVPITYDRYIEVDDILALAPDIVVVATGGLPQMPPLEAGSEHLTSTWDILSGAANPLGEVLVYDDHGGHAALSAAEVMARRGAKVTLASPERYFAPEVGGMNLTPYMKAFHDHDVTLQIGRRLHEVQVDGNRLAAVFGSDFSATARKTVGFDTVIADHGTLPLDELYLALRPLARNAGEIDYRALAQGNAPFPLRHPDAQFWMYRIGDAITSRNLHAGIYDALRYGLLW